MMEKINYYAVERMFPFVFSFIDRSFGSLERCGLKRMNEVSTELVGKLLFHLSGVS